MWKVIYTKSPSSNLLSVMIDAGSKREAYEKFKQEYPENEGYKMRLIARE